jgi:hypothetical protein
MYFLKKHKKGIEKHKTHTKLSVSDSTIFNSSNILKFIFWINVLFFMSCTSKKSRFTLSIEQKSDSQNSQLQNVNFYLETSGSMRGYVNSNIQGTYPLKDVLPFIVTDINNTFNLESNLYTVSDNLRKYGKTNEDFFRELRSGIIFGGGSSKLQRIFSDIISKTTSGDVNFLITDCIPDLGQGLDSRAQSSLITNEIYRSLLENPLVSTVVFKFHSDFNGTHYFNRKNQGAKNFHKRPFYNEQLKNRPLYIWVFGEAYLLNQIVSKELIDGYNGVHAYNFPFNEVNIGLTKALKSGKVAINEEDQTLVIEDAEKRKPAQFSIGMDLSNNSIFNQERLINTSSISVFPEYLSNASEVEIQSKRKIVSESKTRDKASVQSSLFTHYVRIKLTQFDQNVEEIGVAIQTTEPNWITSTHIDDDIDISSEDLEGKTFGFKYITAAFERASKKDSTVLTLTLTKQKRN